jgi:hypothetical protein
MLNTYNPERFILLRVKMDSNQGRPFLTFCADLVQHMDDPKLVPALQRLQVWETYRGTDLLGLGDYVVVRVEGEAIPALEENEYDHFLHTERDVAGVESFTLCRGQNGGEVVIGRFPSRDAALASIGR